MDDEKWMWEPDDDFTRSLLSRQDRQAMINQYEDMRLIKAAAQFLCVGVAWLLLGPLVPAGFLLPLCGLLVYVSSRVRSWLELYSFKRQMAREFSSEFPE